MTRVCDTYSHNLISRSFHIEEITKPGVSVLLQDFLQDLILSTHIAPEEKDVKCHIGPQGP